MPSAAPAAAAQDIVTTFQNALTNAEQKTGVTATSSWVAQGTYDYILQILVDTTRWPGPAVQGGGTPSPQQIAIGFAAALAQNAGVTTETVAVVPLNPDIKAVAAHSCG